MNRQAFFSVIFALVFCLIDAAVFSHLAFFKWRPDVVLVLVLYSALYNGSETGVVTGFFSGLILDILSLAPMGLHSAVFVLIGYFAGKLYGKYNVNRSLITIGLTVIALLIQIAIQIIARFIFGQNILFPPLSEPDFWICMAVTVVLSPLVFFICNLFPTLLQGQNSL